MAEHRIAILPNQFQPARMEFREGDTVIFDLVGRGATVVQVFEAGTPSTDLFGASSYLILPVGRADLTLSVILKRAGNYFLTTSKLPAPSRVLNAAAAPSGDNLLAADATSDIIIGDIRVPR